ncbi:TetR/AcrR family transcriptional regulator [Kibdelosporangium philippinense]|uniref:TetR/AcrR family transcriptional regulator n=1 Tax=Kibdelosporangium philippinense TaxID=211113 RepID=A0ABS8ZHX8_9PSEU|nr:TetR/AcrR family transcriptional regulator [Kibdelosporangium philippinense]MCE7005442.1 TetR/AcrR family transcriptional regulator [Kibdelosporangium philippinense]
MTETERPLRADARRNRARVLEVAQQVFETEGLAVPVDEVAKRAGVGIGTVYRHFPTKEALLEAILISRVEALIADAQALAGASDPGAAFFGFVVRMVRQVVGNKALGEALVSSGFDPVEVLGPTHAVLRAAQDHLLARAQEAGAVRKDVTGADVKAIIVGIIAAERHTDDGEPGRLGSIMIESLRA